MNDNLEAVSDPRDFKNISLQEQNRLLAMALRDAPAAGSIISEIFRYFGPALAGTAQTLISSALKGIRTWGSETIVNALDSIIPPLDSTSRPQGFGSQFTRMNAW